MREVSVMQPRLGSRPTRERARILILHHLPTPGAEPFGSADHIGVRVLFLSLEELTSAEGRWFSFLLVFSGFLRVFFGFSYSFKLKKTKENYKKTKENHKKTRE